MKESVFARGRSEVLEELRVAAGWPKCPVDREEIDGLCSGGRDQQIELSA